MGSLRDRGTITCRRMIALLEAHRAGLLASRALAAQHRGGHRRRRRGAAAGDGVRHRLGRQAGARVCTRRSSRDSLVSAFGGSRVQIAGPTGAFIVILAGITAEHGIDGLADRDVAGGHHAAAARRRATRRDHQVHSRSGDPRLHGGHRSDHLDRAVAGLLRLAGASRASTFTRSSGRRCRCCPSLHLRDDGASPCLRLLVVVAAPRLPRLKRVPGPLVGLVDATLLQATFHFPGVATIGSAFGGIPQRLPTLQMPEIRRRA